MAVVSVAWAQVALLWRRLFRDRIALVFTFAIPIATAVVMVTIYQAENATIGVVGSEHAVDRALEAELRRSGLLQVIRFDDREALDDALRGREVVAGVIGPGDDLPRDAPATVTIVGSPGVATPSGVRSVIERAVGRTAAELSVGRAIDGSAPDDIALTTGAQALDDHRRRTDPESSPEERRSMAAGEALVGTLVLFVFTNTMGGASLLPEMRTLGILARNRTTPASTSTTILGFVVGFGSYALLQAALIVATGWILFGVTWRSVPAVLVVITLTAAVASALAVLIGTLLRSPELGATVAGPLGFLLGMLGGCLWPLEIVGPTLRRIGNLTPHAWAVSALRSTGVEGHSLGAVARSMWILVAMLAVFAVLAGLRLTNQVRRA